MENVRVSNLCLMIDHQTGDITSLCLYGQEILYVPSPLFRIGLRGNDGEKILLSSHDAGLRNIGDSLYTFDGFPIDIAVNIHCGSEEPSVWNIHVDNRSAAQIEWVEFPCVTLKPLRENGGKACVAYPYNEGVLIDDIHRHIYREPDYPSYSAFDMFPNMVSSQFMLYLTGNVGLYFAAHDPQRGVKQFSFYEDRGGVALQLRLYCGTEPGQNYESHFPCILQAFEGDWQDGAVLYRNWFSQNLPAGLTPTAQSDLPDWYKETPLVVSYPVRGIHDTDVMSPNAFFPYTKALPMLESLAERTGSRLLVLLMHWEGTAPWAPPYVWPPFGGERLFNQFADDLHREGHMLGVYCSGFGYTIKSNLIDNYSRQEEYMQHHLHDIMCVGPNGELKSVICRAQRFGYDICVCAPGAKKILKEAYEPLLRSKVDYAQILDQNHGGGQYFCYSTSHGHPPAPGTWMTQSMTELLSEWNRIGEGKLLGCESAAGEAFIPYLRFSDNRYELNWNYGVPIPMYAFIYHEYLRNFMGNQVSCGLSNEEDTLRYRMAYSFAAGDCMTLVFAPNGRLFASWGDHDFTKPAPDLEKTIDFVSNMRACLDRGADDFLFDAQMIRPLPVVCEEIVYHRRHDHSEVIVPAIVTSAWAKSGRRIQLLINHTDVMQMARVGGNTYEIPPRDGQLINLT